MTVLANATVVLPDEIRDRSWLRVDGGQIIEIGQGPRSGDVVDLAGRWVVPGFVDLHVHGGAGASYPGGDVDEARRAAAFHRGHGTTTALASLVTAPLDEMARAASMLAGLVDEGLLAGIHLEGPYLSPARCGAQDPRHLRRPDVAELAFLLEAGRGNVRVVTVAPELPGGLELVRAIVDAGSVAAVGHTDATFEETRAAIDAGARLATHLHNGMRPFHHRDPGPIAALLERPQAICEVIADGVHLHHAVIAHAFAAAGAARIALVTDAIEAAGTSDGTYTLGGRVVHVTHGVATLADGSSLAGSTLTMDRALRHVVHSVGVPLVEAVTAASTTPARVLGLSHLVGTIELGKDADLVVLDQDLKLVAVMAHGNWLGGGPASPS